MLRELQHNILPGRGPSSAPDGKTHDMRQGTENKSLLQASASNLPSSEEDLEDFSSDSSQDEREVRQNTLMPRRRLVRLDEETRPAPLQPEDDLVKGLASLGFGPSPRHTTVGSGVGVAGTAVQSIGVADAAEHVPDSEVESEDQLSDDDDEEPFFERLAPTINARTAPASASRSSAPEPGSLVLGEQKQYVLPPPVARKLYPHQVEGVKWLWSLFAMQRGGILGDDMGLGKTMQCSAFLAGLFASQLVSRVIIIAPKTLLPHWIKELGVCGLRGLTHEFFGSSESERTAALRSVANGRGIIVTTYGMVQHNSDLLARPPTRSSDRAFGWDVIFLDEGHKIKNPKMKLVEHLRQLPARVRIIISGTPIQNNLMEMHSLFDFTTCGLLGDAKTFKKNYGQPITKGMDKEATDREKQTGAAIAAELRKRVEPYFLRREKKDVLTDGGNGGSSRNRADGSGPSTSSSSVAGGSEQVGQAARSLPRKNDLVVWLRLTPFQRKIYTAFLHTDSVRQVLNEKASPLAAITVLKKICDHPALLTQRAATSVISAAHRWAQHRGPAGRSGRRTSLDDFIVDTDEEAEGEEEESDGSGCDDDERPVSARDDPCAEWLGDAASLDKELARELEQRGAEASCKTAFVLKLLERLHAEGHRTLIFSQSKVMLSILEAGVKAMKLSYCRIDGDVASAEERQAHVQRFQTSDIPVFLLTSQVGGLGLTLTAADRVIIVDPAWNPSVDDQSVDRAYRLGQTRDVVVYRLVTCGTVEEKIYRRQVFKGGLSKTGTEEGIQFRYFTQTELRDLFSVTAEGLQRSDTQVQLRDMHAHQRNASEETHRHLEQVLRMDTVAGIHDHNLLFSQRPAEPVPSAQDGAAILSQMTGSAPVNVDALTSMLGSGLKLGSNAESMKREAAVSALRNEVVDLATRIRSTELTISSGQCDKMLDRGAKMKENLRAMQMKHAKKLEELAALEGARSSAPGADAGAGRLPKAGQVHTVPTTESTGDSQSHLSAGHAQASQQQTSISGRKFGSALISRRAAGRESTDSGTSSDVTLVCPGDQRQQHQPAQRQRPERQEAGPARQRLSGDGPSTPICLDNDEASFVTAASAGGQHNEDEDGDVTSNVIDLTDTP